MFHFNVDILRQNPDVHEVSLTAHKAGFSTPVFLSHKLLKILTPDMTLRQWGVHTATNVKSMLELLSHLSGRGETEEVEFDFAVARWDPTHEMVSTRDLCLTATLFPVVPIPFTIVSLSSETAEISDSGIATSRQ